MPQFTTISPTHVPGKKEYAWQQFLKGGYVAIGWLHDDDVTGKKMHEIEDLIRPHNYENEVSAIESFRKFLSLSPGDYVAVNNVNKGLFGVGEIMSGYKYQLDKHDTGSEDGDSYCHYREVKWISTAYMPRTSLISEGETAWVPYGTMGKLYADVPPYITRILNPRGPLPATKIEYIRPHFLETVIDAV